MLKKFALSPRLAFRRWQAFRIGYYAGLVMILALSASVAYAQGIPRGGRLQCRNLPAGVTATATLTWTQGGQDILPPNPTDTWICAGNTADVHDTEQPERANDWHLTITFTDTTTGAVLGTCDDSDTLFFAGHPQNFTSRCRLSPEGAMFRLGRSGA
ncbi:MAG TPA: hypothetical protein VJL59_05700 [Anaerolineales bacterium]|nr:hypothetical protein [Anaerolineales bacterium]